MKIIYGVAAVSTIVAVVFAIWWAYVTASYNDQHKIIAFVLTIAVVCSVISFCIIFYQLTKKATALEQIHRPAPTTKENQPSPATAPLLPDTTVKESDPQLEIKFEDLRERTGSAKPEDRWCFDLINRGKSSFANFACIEDFSIHGHHIAFRRYPPPIGPHANHGSINCLYINNPDGKLSEKDIFRVFFEAWDALKKPELYELSIPIKATYQDDFRNLFEVRCDLVFYPGEHIKIAAGSSGANGTHVIEIKHLKLRKVSPATIPTNWID